MPIRRGMKTLRNRLNLFGRKQRKSQSEKDRFFEEILSLSKKLIDTHGQLAYINLLKGVIRADQGTQGIMDTAYFLDGHVGKFQCVEELKDLLYDVETIYSNLARAGVLDAENDSYKQQILNQLSEEAGELSAEKQLLEETLYDKLPVIAMPDRTNFNF